MIADRFLLAVHQFVANKDIFTVTIQTHQYEIYGRQWRLRAD